MPVYGTFNKDEFLKRGFVYWLGEKRKDDLGQKFLQNYDFINVLTYKDVKNQGMIGIILSKLETMFGIKWAKFYKFRRAHHVRRKQNRGCWLFYGRLGRRRITLVFSESLMRPTLYYGNKGKIDANLPTGMRKPMAQEILKIKDFYRYVGNVLADKDTEIPNEILLSLQAMFIDTL